MMTFVGTT